MSDLFSGGKVHYTFANINCEFDRNETLFILVGHNDCSDNISIVVWENTQCMYKAHRIRV